MLLLIAAAFAGQGVSFVEPPRLNGPRMDARVRVEDSEGDRLKLHWIIDGHVRPTRAHRAIRDGVATMLTFDASGSFRRHHDTAFALADTYVTDRLQGESVGVMVFGRSAEQWAPSSDETVIRANLDAARGHGAAQKETRLAAFIREAVDAVSDAHPGSDGGVRRVVVFTDAGEESQVYDVDEIARFARDRRVLVDAVVFARTGAGSYAEDLDRIARLTQLTGGDVVEIHGSEVPEGAMEALSKRPLSLFDVRAKVCGDGPLSVAVRGPLGILSETVVAEGVPPKCRPKGDGRSPQDTGAARPATRPVEPAMAAPRGPPGKLAGLLCLALALLVLVFLGAAAWLVASRDEVDPKPRDPAPRPPVAPSPPETPPVVEPPVPEVVEPEKHAFSMNLPETHLLVVGGEIAAGTRWRFAGRILRVGASAEGNEVVVDLPQISSRHARFELYPSGSVFAEDLGSSNGTWVGPRRLVPNERVEVPPGTRIALSSQLVVVVEQPNSVVPGTVPRNSAAGAPNKRHRTHRGNA
ncbi:MAG: FHA domain-containing protein [Myxococcota bacterium]